MVTDIGGTKINGQESNHALGPDSIPTRGKLPMDRRLLSYLPPVLRDVLEFQTINAANEPEIAVAWDALTLVLANQFLTTADEHGVTVWEQELKIYPKDTDSLDVRKARIKALWNMELPYSVPWLRGWLAGVWADQGTS